MTGSSAQVGKDAYSKPAGGSGNRATKSLRACLQFVLVALGFLLLGMGSASAQTVDLKISAMSAGAVVTNANGSWTIPVTYTVTNIGTADAQLSTASRQVGNVVPRWTAALCSGTHVET